MKQVAILAILMVLILVIMLSHTFSQGRVQRISCVHNQEAMRDAVLSYQADHAGNQPARMRSLFRYYSAGGHFGVCPANDRDVYSYDPSSGAVACPNPEHRVHL